MFQKCSWTVEFFLDQYISANTICRVLQTLALKAQCPSWAKRRQSVPPTPWFRVIHSPIIQTYVCLYLHQGVSGSYRLLFAQLWILIYIIVCNAICLFKLSKLFTSKADHKERTTFLRARPSWTLLLPSDVTSYHCNVDSVWLEGVGGPARLANRVHQF